MRDLIYILAIIVISTSCSEDFFTNELDIDLIEQEDLLNVVALIDGDENSLVVSVSNTRAVGSDDPIMALNNATVQLYADDQFVADLVLISEGRYVLLESFDFNAGQEQFRVEVTHPDFPDTEATVDRPRAVMLTDVLIDTNRRNIDDDYVTTVSLVDPAEDNYYLLQAEVVQDGTIRNDIRLESDFESFYVETSLGLLFDDRTFNDTDAELLITVPSFSVNRSDTADFRLISLNEELYEYLITAEYASENEDNPFAEPVLIPEDFENAVGVLGMFRRRITRARIE